MALAYSQLYSGRLRIGDRLQDGYGILVGAEHRNRFGFEVQYNGGKVPAFYFVITYRLTALKRDLSLGGTAVSTKKTARLIAQTGR